MKTTIKTVTVLKYHVNAELRLYTKVFYKSGREKTYYGFEVPKTVCGFKANHAPAVNIEHDHAWYVYGDKP